MRTTPHSSWGAPCKGTIKTIVRSDGLKLPVRLELVELITILIDETERRGYDVKPGQTWGYSCRRIAGSSSWSNHAWGLAVDINAPSNPMTNRLVTDMPSWMPALWKSYGFRWGGDYSGRKDAMHYEFLGSVQDAAAQTVKARKAFVGGPAPVPTPGVESGRPFPAGAEKLPGGGYSILQGGSVGEKVRYIQKRLIANGHDLSQEGGADGRFGPGLEREVKAFQAHRGLTADGVVGPLTWARLG